MQLRIDQALAFAPRQVFAACRDHLPELLPWLPHVEAIERVLHEPAGEQVRTAYRWTVKTRIPSMLRGILGGERFSWTDHALWDERRLSCAWWTESAARLRVHCAAEDTFEAQAHAGTLLRIRGELRVEPESLPAPRALQLLLAVNMERFLAHKMGDDVAHTTRALAAYLTSRSS